MRAKVRETSEIWTWAGATCLVGAAVSAELAWLHARAIQALGVICGTQPSPHCIWCPTALVLLAAGMVLISRSRRRHADPAYALAKGRAGRSAEAVRRR